MSDSTNEETPEFVQAVKDVKELDNVPNDKLLELYGLYKQVKEGSNETPKPSVFSGPKIRAKWDAWESQKGKANLKAQEEYVALVEELKEKYSKKS
ncbi:hypothetical protein [Parasitella parasitica]|uniref:ACB domain-containing protein n=1 Tax=Parasitella parasitica TaxID=35722 RepID=A0A0B7NQM9_9FUNG|nr:hypothetical protein [Parasitella parasitica]